MTEKRNIKELVDKESDNLHNLLDSNDVSAFKGMVDELRDTWTKKQIFRTETEMRFSVLGDLKYPTKEAKIKWLEKKLQKETDEYKKECYEIDLDQKRYDKASMELTARDRMREIKLWSKLKKENDDGTFDKNNVNTHQLESYHKIMLNKKNTITAGSSQPEVFNVLGQLQTIERIKKERGELEGTERKTISSQQELGAKSE